MITKKDLKEMLAQISRPHSVVYDGLATRVILEYLIHGETLDPQAAASFPTQDQEPRWPANKPIDPMTVPHQNDGTRDEPKWPTSHKGVELKTFHTTIFEIECLFYYYALASEGDFTGGYRRASDLLLDKTFAKLVNRGHLHKNMEMDALGRFFSISLTGIQYVERLQACR